VTVHRDMRGLGLAQRVLSNPRSSDRALRAALADCLRILASVQANWMEDMQARRAQVQVLSEMLADLMERELAAYRPARPDRPRLRVVRDRDGAS